MKISPFAVVVLEHLRHTEWKSLLELYREIQKNWKEEGLIASFLSNMLSLSRELRFALLGPSVGKLYVALDELETHGLAISRWRNDSPEALSLRGGRRTKEWKMTRKGARVRHSIEPGQEDYTGISTPASG